MKLQTFRLLSMAAVTISAAAAIANGTSGASAAANQPPPPPAPKPSGERITQALITKSVPAKSLFIQKKSAAPFRAAAIGNYSRGCLSGAEQMPVNGPTWQAMRLSRNRRWGHPATIALIKRLSKEARQYDGWPGLLVGDISMARGGPMWPSHSSHQIGLDADIWFTPMPDRTLSRKERETMSATYMLTKDQLSVNPKVWSREREKLIKRVASYPEVQRVLVHPAIKKQLCLSAGTDRSWLAKVRPVWGHNYHFHIRLHCPPGSRGCRPQRAVPKVDGCGAELATWYRRLRARLKPLDCKAAENRGRRVCFCRIKANKSDPRCKVRKRRRLTLSDLPNACSNVLAAN